MPMNPDELRAAGNWVKELRVILKRGNGAGKRPSEDHRSTRKAVRLLLSNLRIGVASPPQAKDALDSMAQYDRTRLVVFNAVEQLMDDKVAKSKTKTKLEALAKFKLVLAEEFKAEAKKKGGLKDEWKSKINEAINGLKYEEMEKEFLAGRRNAEELLDVGVLAERPKVRAQVLKALDPDKLSEEKRALWFDEGERAFRSGGIPADEMLTSDVGKKMIQARPNLRGEVVCSLDPARFDELDMDALFGPAKNDVMAEGLMAIAQKRPDADGVAKINPAMFTKLKKQFSAKRWNDKGRALGPRVCMELWRSGNYDQIVELIKYDVDTSVAARVTGTEGTGGGVYSGFVQPIQHVVSQLLFDVSKLGTDKEGELGGAKAKAQGAQKILTALEEKDAAVTLTSWKAVKKSELVTEFKDNPGTIWGFEDVRIPYVQAAHEMDGGAQPVRMIEIWEAVEQSLTPAAYARLLKDPDGAAEEFIKLGVEKIEKGMDSTNAKDVAKFREVKKKKDEYIRNFKIQAKSFLMEFAAQMPKTSFINAAVDESGKVRQEKSETGGDVDISLSDVAGVQQGKFAGGLACKAGLYWAKEEKKPVYYCLDGINMDDVINYKKAKIKAIEDFIAAGGKTAGAKGHDEVITMVELREILKNWGELQGTVKFVEKGEILKGPKLDKKVKKWQDKMTAANKAAGRTPAPPRANFTAELKALDPALLAKLPAGPVGDMDARDLVKKSGFLVNVAKTRPQLVLKYLMAKCTVLTKYDLIPANLPVIASQLSAAEEKDRAGLSAQLLREIKLCHPKFRDPLEAAMIRYPVKSATV